MIRFTDTILNKFKALAHFYTGNYFQALYYFDQIHKDKLVHYYLGQIFLEKGDLQFALEHFRESAKMGYGPSLILLEKVMSDDENLLYKTIDLLKSYMKANEPFAYVALANLYIKNKDKLMRAPTFDEILDILKRAYEIAKPENKGLVAAACYTCLNRPEYKENSSKFFFKLKSIECNFGYKNQGIEEFVCDIHQQHGFIPNEYEKEFFDLLFERFDAYCCLFGGLSLLIKEMNETGKINLKSEAFLLFEYGSKRGDYLCSALAALRYGAEEFEEFNRELANSYFKNVKIKTIRKLPLAYERIVKELLGKFNIVFIGQIKDLINHYKKI